MSHPGSQCEAAAAAFEREEEGGEGRSPLSRAIDAD